MRSSSLCKVESSALMANGGITRGAVDVGKRAGPTEGLARSAETTHTPETGSGRVGAKKGHCWDSGQVAMWSVSLLSQTGRFHPLSARMPCRVICDIAYIASRQCRALAAGQRIGGLVQLNGSSSRECSMMGTLAVSKIVNYRQPVNARVALVTLPPGVTVSGLFEASWLFCTFDGLQSGRPALPGTNAFASTV